MQAELEDLKHKILEVSRDSEIKDRVKTIDLEEDSDDQGNGFLRVIIGLEHADDIDDSKIEALIEKIEAAVIQIDERFPSVRFADAA